MRPSADLTYALEPEECDGLRWRRIRLVRTTPPGSVVRLWDEEGIVAEFLGPGDVLVLEAVLGEKLLTQLRVTVTPPTSEAP